MNVIRASRLKTLVGTGILRVSLILYLLRFHSVVSERQSCFNNKLLPSSEVSQAVQGWYRSPNTCSKPGLFYPPVPPSLAHGCCLQVLCYLLCDFIFVVHTFVQIFFLLLKRKWQPTPLFLRGKSHGWRSLVGYSPCDHKESDTTK